MADKKLEVNVQHIIKDIEAGKFTSFQSILNEAGGQHIYEAVNEELRKYLKENNAVMISATQLAHLRETGYKDFESERKALETQLKTATGDLKKQIESKLKDLKKFQYYSERKAPIGDELHKILELSDKGLVDLNDAVKAANQIMQQMQIDPHTSEKLKSLVGRTSTDTMKNFRKAIKNAQDFQKMKISAGMIGGETETARSMAFKKDGKLYVISGSTDWTKAKEGKIGDYKTTASFSAMHNLIQSVVNATLIRAQEGEDLPITSKVAHLPISAGRTKYSNTLPGVYDINVGSYQEGAKLISDLVDVLEGKRDYTSIRIPGSVQGKVEKGQFTYKNEIKEATYYNGKPIGQWIGQTVEEVKGLLDSLAPQQRQQFLGTLFGQTDGKPWYNTENAKVLKEAFRGLYQPIEKQYKTYGGMTLGALSGKFSTGDIGKQDVINAIKEGVRTQIDAEELASRLFYGGEKYYSEAFVKVIQDAIPEISDKMTEIFDRELDKDMPGYLSGLSEEEKPKPSKYEMYQPDVWELEEKRQQAWIESGIERKRLGYTDKPLFDDKGVTTLADRMTRLVDFYQRVNNIFTNIANDINKDLPEGTQAYTGEELARTYLARKSPEVYDRYMRSKGLYEQFASEAQNLSIEDQVKWIREQLDTFIAEEGNLLNTFDTFNEIADERSKKIFSTEFARKIGYVGKPSDYVAPGTLYGLLTGSTFGVAQEYQLSEFDKQRGLDIYGRTLSPEALDKLEETQIDDDISKIDFYKKRLSEMTEELGISSEKMKIFTDYLDKVQKVADQAGIELDQVLEGIDEKGFIKKGSLLDKQLSELGEMPVETDLYLPHGKRGLSASERSTLMGLLDETGMDNLTTQYEVYLNEQDNKRKEELQKQEEIRVEKEKEFTKLMDSELENRLKFLYAETQKPEYLKRQEAAEREEDLGLTEEMFKNFPEKPQKGLDVGSDSIEELADNTQKASDGVDEFTKQIEKDTEVSKELENKITTAVNDQTVFGAGAHGGGTTTMNFSPNGILPVYATSVDLADLSRAKATSITTDYEGHTIGKTYKFLNDKVFADYGPGGLQAWIEKWKDQDMQAAQAELIGILTKVPSYKKSSGGLSKAGRNAMDEILTDTFGDKYKPQQGTGAILEETKGIHKDTTDIKNMLSPVFGGGGGSNTLAAFNNIDWNAFQQWMEGQSNKTGISSDEGGAPAGGSGGRGGGKRGKSDEEKTEADLLKSQKQDIKDYQQYMNKLVSLESQVDKFQRQAALSSGKQKDAIENTVDALNQEIDALNSSNSGLVERVSREQAATKAQIDSTAALRKQTNEQKNLVSVKGATSIWDMMANDIRRATMRIADFGVAAKVLNKIPQDIQKVIQYTKELDAAMTNIRIVGGYTEEQAKSLMKSYTELGKTLGATTTEIAEGMNNWLRQGYEAEDQLEALVSASTKLSKLGMISASEATTALTSALKAFNLTAEDAIKVVDKLTKVDQLAAVSAGGIAESLQKASTSAKLAGMSMDELIGSVSVIGEVTQQSMDTVGNAMKSILARYGNVKAGVFTSMGLDDDGETAENINDIEKVLSKLGIRVRSSATEMRSITDVLDEVNSKWSTFDTVTKNAIATAFGGSRMRENFLVLMENWDRVKELTEESANAAGTADEKYTAYMDSMEAATKRLQNAWEGFTQSLETSSVMKFLTNTAALFVENVDKLKYILTALAAVNSAKIFDFFTSKGETGGLKGLLSNIPILGDRMKTNNILESIDRKVGEIQGEVKKGNATKNGGLISRIKAGFAQRKTDKELANFDDSELRALYTQRLEDGADYFDEKGYQKALKTLGISEQSKQEAVARLAADKAMRVRAFGKIAAVAGITTAATQLFTNKQVSGYGQTVEETSGDKALRVGASTAGAIAGSATALIPVIGPIIAPIASSLGSVFGGGLAGLISKWFHKDELQMKQRVQEAKENLTALNSIEEAINSNKDILEKDKYDTEDFKTLKSYTDSLRETMLDNKDLSDAFLSDINASGIGSYITMEEIYSQINKGNAEINKALKQQLEITTSRLKVENTLSKQESDRAAIKKETDKDINNGVFGDFDKVIKGKSTASMAYYTPKLLEMYGELQQAGLLQYSTTTKTDYAIGYTKEEFEKIAVAGGDIYEKLNNAEKILAKVRLNAEAGEDVIAAWEKVVNDYRKQADELTRLNKELLSTQVDYIYLTSDILNNFTPDEIYNLGFEGIVDLIRDQLIEQGVDVVDEMGVIHKDVYDIIAAKIRTETTLYNYLTKSDRGIGKFISENDVKAIEAFARAFGITADEAKKLGEQFGYLTRSMGMMNVQETTEYYEKLGNVFSKLASNANLTASEINNLLSTSELKDLFPYLAGEGGTDVVLKELYKRLYGGGQDIHMENALYDATMEMNTDYFVDYLKERGSDDFVNFISKKGYKTLLSIREDFDDLNEEQKQEFLDYLGAISYTYKKDLTVLEKPAEYLKSQLENQINNLQEQKDALSEINNEREKEIELIKAKNALENAKKEKRRVYRAGVGFTYETNEDAIAEAQKNLENLNIQKRQDDLQMQIDMLQLQKNIIEALPNQEELEQTKKIYELWAADASVDGSLASVAEKVTALSDAYQNATAILDLRAKTENWLQRPEDEPKRETSNERTNPTVVMNSEQIKETQESINSNVGKILGILETSYGGKSLQGAGKNATGTKSFAGGAALINELGTEAIITPSGTVTALPSKTGIVPADITKNLWSLGEVAPTLVARLSSLNQKAVSGVAGNTTYEEGQYFDNFTMNVYPTKDYDMEKLLSEARAKVRLTRHNN